MKLIKYKISSVILSCILCTQFSFAQQVGSSETAQGFSLIAGTESSNISETFNIGPGDYEINGTWKIYAKNVWIHPNAQIIGSGKIEIYNPAEANGTINPTSIDGNNNQNIKLNIDHNNANGWILADIIDPGFNATNPLGSKKAAFKLSDDNTNVNLNLNIDGADILLNGNDLELTAKANIVNPSANRMIITGNSIDNLVIGTNDASIRTFPIGATDGDYAPVIIDGTGTYNVAVVDNTSSDAPIFTSNNDGVNKFWIVFGSTANSVQLQNNNTNSGANYDESQGYITQNNGGNWSTSNTSDYVGPGIHENSSVGQYIPQSISGNGAWLSKTTISNALPITLINFTAKKVNHQSNLDWTTASEINSKGFEIQHSIDGSKWMKIGYLDSKAKDGNSSSIINYNFVHSNPTAGKNYYRLYHLDINNTGKISNVVSLNYNQFNTINVYPNPTKSSVNINGIDKGNLITLTDISGKFISKHTAKATDYELDMSHLIIGTYIVNIYSDNENIASFKVTKVE